MKCKSCGFELIDTAKYCSECGGEVITKRLTIRNLLGKVFQLITNLESPFLKTTSALFTDVNSVTLSYINGKRKVITSPVRYALIALTIYGVFQFLFKDFMAELAESKFMEGMVDGFGDSSHERSDEQLGRLDNLFSFIQKHNQFTNFLVIPILASICSLVFRKSRFNIAEHISIALYAISFSLLLGATLGIILGSFGSGIVGDIYSFLTVVINVVLVNRILWKTYDTKLIKVIGVFILSYFIMLLLFVVSVIVYGILG